MRGVKGGARVTEASFSHQQAKQSEMETRRHCEHFMPVSRGTLVAWELSRTQRWLCASDAEAEKVLVLTAKPFLLN